MLGNYVNFEELVWSRLANCICFTRIVQSVHFFCPLIIYHMPSDLLRSTTSYNECTFDIIFWNILNNFPHRLCKCCYLIRILWKDSCVLQEAANGVVRKRSLKIRDRFLRLTHAKAPDATPKKTDSGKPRGGPKQRTPFTPGSKSREGGDSNKRKEPASSSYQGLKSTKSGVVKKAKVIQRPSSNQGKQQVRPSETGQSDSSRKGKRPAVAARKAKQLTKKRKLDGSTPQNTHRSKKARK